ncbi:MAG: rubredoxin [Clostridiales bacterium]|nr:rubredoxin [Clostridiales bacterium]
MSKYVCQICGYVYDEDTEKVKFDDLPADWTCPLCGAPKDMFKKAEDKPAEPEKKPASVKPITEEQDEMRELTDGELAAVFSNLARGCEKQYKAEEAKLYAELASYCTAKVNVPENADFAALLGKINENLADEFVTAKNDAENGSDRGAKRVLTWSEKVTRITASILSRYEKEGNSMIENTKIWVCDICGFIFIGDVPPAVCPICKVPSFKILEVARV